MIFYSDIKEDKDFVVLEHPVEVATNIVCLGFFPYHIKRIRGIKISSRMYKSIFDKMQDDRTNGRLVDNKQVFIFEDRDSFGTSSFFGMFYHDAGCIIGELEDITKY